MLFRSAQRSSWHHQGASGDVIRDRHWWLVEQEPVTYSKVCDQLWTLPAHPCHDGRLCTASGRNERKHQLFSHGGIGHVNVIRKSTVFRRAHRRWHVTWQLEENSPFYIFFFNKKMFSTSSSLPGRKDKTSQTARGKAKSEMSRDHVPIPSNISDFAITVRFEKILTARCILQARAEQYIFISRNTRVLGATTSCEKPLLSHNSILTS